MVSTKVSKERLKELKEGGTGICSCGEVRNMDSAEIEVHTYPTRSFEDPPFIHTRAWCILFKSNDPSPWVGRYKRFIILDNGSGNKTKFNITDWEG